MIQSQKNHWLLHSVALSRLKEEGREHYQKEQRKGHQSFEGIKFNKLNSAVSLLRLILAIKIQDSYKDPHTPAFYGVKTIILYIYSHCLLLVRLRAVS